jgi:uncharacterized membrane protein
MDTAKRIVIAGLAGILLYAILGGIFWGLWKLGPSDYSSNFGGMGYAIWSPGAFGSAILLVLIIVVYLQIVRMQRRRQQSDAKKE